MATVYLAGHTKEFEYREYCKENYSSFFKLLDPIQKTKELLNHINYDEYIKNNYCFNDSECNQTVDTDKELIEKSDVLVAYIQKPTFGTIMEIKHAYENDIPVHIINPELTYKDDIWLRYHSTYIHDSIDDCFSLLKQFYNPYYKNVIAITGKAGSGKDTVASFLEENYGYKNYKFAEPIYGILKVAFNLSDEKINALKRYDENKEAFIPGYTDITYRKALQLIGTEFFRNSIDKDIWASNLIDRLRTSSDNKIVISDLRFPNELEALKKYKEHFNLNVIKVVRPNSGLDKTLAEHESELYDLPANIEIYNDKGLPELYNEIEIVLQETNHV